ncbi:MAG: ribonuclease HII [Micromonosporaceae bacterium]
MLSPTRTVVRREGGLYALERALRRRGFANVAGADEAGRGACAGPLVAAAVVLPDGKRGEVPELADSKLLTAAARERVYAEVTARAVDHVVVVMPPGEVDGRGLQVCNIQAMRRALAGLAVRPDYVLTDGFPVDGLGAPGLAVWKGDQVAACVAAAGVLAKVTRDRIMCQLHERWPEYGFAEHKGYVTPEHAVALRRHGPCPEHRRSYANVAAALEGLTGVAEGTAELSAESVGQNGCMEGSVWQKGDHSVALRDEPGAAQMAFGDGSVARDEAVG